MSRVTSITIGYQRKYKHPFRDFESFQIEGSITVEVDFDETPEEAAAKSFPILRKQLKATFAEFRPREKTK